MVMIMNEYEQDLMEMEQQEKEIQFTSFSHDAALKVGFMLYEEVKTLGKAVTIDISRNNQRLFHFAMEGTTIDNAEWIRRKNNIVNRFGKSSYRVGTTLRMQGKTMEEKYGLSKSDYADHGGAFPLIIKGVGPVGTITVSGLPQKEDHELVVRILRTYLSDLTSINELV
jgi:uncharacterized protein (UPF0303 family)